MMTYKYIAALCAQERGILCLQISTDFTISYALKSLPLAGRSGTPFTKGELFIYFSPFAKGE
jgi:hypothetical protein